MRVAIRADANLVLGTGHVMRCLTLADELHGRGAAVTFLVRAPAPYLAAMIAGRGHALAQLPETPQKQAEGSALAETVWSAAEQRADGIATAGLVPQTDWMIVDHYGLDSIWENTIRVSCRRLMAIDDLARRSHDCELLLDQNLGRDAGNYRGLVPDFCEIYAGPRYALLRPEFAQARGVSLARRTASPSNRILISMGGVDKDNATGKILSMLSHCQLPADASIVVVMGGHAPWTAAVREQALQMPYPTEVLSNVSEMADLMANSDIAIGAAVGTAWERCCLGLPTLAVTLAENQREGAEALETAGCVIRLDINRIEADFAASLAPLLDLTTRRKMAVASSLIADGSGAALIASRLMERHEH